MKNIQAQYQDLLEGKMSKSNFMRNVRMQFPQHISPVTSYDDSVKILKGKRILSEVVNMNYLTDPHWDVFTQTLMSMGYSKDEFNQLAAAAQNAIETGKLDITLNPKKAAEEWAASSGTMDIGDKIDFVRMQAKEPQDLEELNEAKKPEGVYGHNPNAENDLYRGADHVNYYQMYRGLQYELAQMSEITDENYIKARKKVVDKILKDPDAYKDLQLANFKAVKEMDEDLEMKEVKKNNLNDKPNEMKVVKKDVKGNTQDTLGKKEKKKAKNGKGLQHMTQTPKGKLEAFATPGKEKVLKESINEGDTSYRDKATIDGTTISVGYDNGYGDYTLYFPQIEMYNDKGVADQVLRVTDDSEKAKEYFEKAKELAKSGKDVYDIYKELEKQRMKDRGFGENKEKVMALKEHILDEMTNINDKYEEIRKGSRVKKKADESKFGTVKEWDGHIAEVEWDGGDKESVTRNVLTTQDVPPTPTTKAKFGDKGPQGDLESMWASFTKSQEEPEDKPVNEDPVGQQVAGNPEEEAEMRASRIKELKEKLVKALEKEGIKRNPNTKTLVSTQTPQDDALATQMGYTQTVPSGLQFLGKGK